jgi:electron transfer flavoprotein alpha subunit
MSPIIYIILESDQGKLKPHNQALIHAALQLADIHNKSNNNLNKLEIRGLLIGENLDQLVNFFDLKNSPITKIILFDHPVYKNFLAERHADAIVTYIKNQDDFTKNNFIIAAHSSIGKALLPRVAALIDASITSDITAILTPRVYQRPMYAGNVIETTEVSEHYPVCMTVRVTKFKSCDQIHESGSGLIENVAFVSNNDQSEWVKADQRPADQPSLADAACVVSGGRGLADPVMFKRLMAIADRMKAAQGASRAAVDAGLAPNNCQVGQTGQIVAPRLYFAVGISGAIQHLAGIKDSQIIVAINKDPDAPIFQVADYGLVADVNDVLEEWEMMLTELGY